MPSLVLRRVVGCNSATSSGPPAREHRRIVRILPLDAGTCICGNVLPVDPRANARTTFYIRIPDPLLQPLSATHAPQPGLTPAMLKASPTGTLRGYVDQARLRAAASTPRQTYDLATNRYKQPRVASSATR